MKYRRLFDIRVEHAAFAGAACADLRIRPRAGHPSGERALARHRLQLRQHAGGVEVLVAVGDAFPARPLVRLPADLLLGFELEVAGIGFSHLTDQRPWQGLVVPRYRADSARRGPLPVAEGREGPADRLAFGTAARIEIAGLSDDWPAAPPGFTIALGARQMPWVYYALTRRPRAEALRIQDSKGRPPLRFDVSQLTPRNVASDARGRALLAQHPGHRCHRLMSRRAVPLQAGAREALALYAGSELLIGQLGAPPLQQSTVVALKPSEPRHCLYRVVRY